MEFKRVLIIGNGGREFAIAHSLKKSNPNLQLYNYGAYINPGFSSLCEECVGTQENQKSDLFIVSYAVKKKIQMAVIGPEAFLQRGIVNQLKDVSIPSIGPYKELATLETSKIFTRLMLQNEWGLHLHNPKFDIIYVPDLDWKHSNDIYLQNCFENYNGEFVIKEDGLAGGKGVKLSGEHLNNYDAALSHCDKLIKKGNNFLIEEKLFGKEFSLMSFSDGKIIKSMPIVQDFKRAHNNNKGPNTGGMGSISYSNHRLDFLTLKDVNTAHSINATVIYNIQKKTWKEYKGIIYGSFMKLHTGEIKIIEYNCRFGDPECINVLSLMKTNLLDVFSAIINGKLNDLDIEYDNLFTLCRYLVPQGYPDKPLKDVEVFINNYGTHPTSENIIFASIEERKDTPRARFKASKHTRLYLKGSRTLAIIGKGDTLNEALLSVNSTTENISGPLYYRDDIGIQEPSNINISVCTSCSKSHCGSSIGNPNCKDCKFWNANTHHVEYSDDDYDPLINDSNNKCNSYADSGVNIDKGNQVVDNIQKYIQSTANENTFDNFGDFGGLFRFHCNGPHCNNNRILVSSTDGVGTKSIMAQDLMGNQGYYNLGKDIVNHCINDILVKGACPLFFLDYFASSKLDPEQVELFVKGISESCKDVGCALIGGETAEMPDVYCKGRTDLVGTIIGSVSETDIIDGKRDIKQGDAIIGLRSSGPHTNGFSYLRSLYNNNNFSDEFAKTLLTPHRSYFHDIFKICKANIDIHALCHVTGGGLIDNPKRVLPDDCSISWNHYDMGKLFNTVRAACAISDYEFKRIFNCGIGMLIFVNSEDKENVMNLFDSDYVVDMGEVV